MRRAATAEDVMGFTRRELLRLAGIGLGVAAGAGADTVAWAGRPRSDRGAGPREGIHLDWFTFRPGDTIHFRVSLVGSVQTTLSLYRLDQGSVYGADQLVASYPIAVDNLQRLVDPGILGAGFSVALSLPASDLAPGFYEARIPVEHIQPENRSNSGNGFTTYNHLIRFVVTPSSAGSHSKILALFDSLTGVAYSASGGASIYGPSTLARRSVSWRRPGLEMATEHPREPLRFLRGRGFAFEFIDLIDLALQPAGFLDAYDLVLAVGQFEYMPEHVLRNLTAFVESGGNLLAATHEFAIFRVRLEWGASQLTTYKWDWQSADPYALSGDPAAAPAIAGVGMNLPASTLETELIGQTVWAAHRATQGVWVDMPIFNGGDVSWILAGTGFEQTGLLPGAFCNYASGNLLSFDAGGRPVIEDIGRSRTPSETRVWAAVPSPDARAWWAAQGRDVAYWPFVSNGYATATVQQRASGGTVVTLPSPQFFTSHFGHSGYERLLVNLTSNLSSR